MNKNIWILMGLIGAITFSGCKKDFEEINTNPNEPTAVSTGFLLTAAQKRIMDEYYDSFWGSRRGMQLSQYWSSNQYSNESRYQFRTETTNGAWRDFYAGPLQDLQTIIDLNTNSPEDVVGYGANANQIAVASLLQAWVFQHLTDAFGAIPMSEALQKGPNPNTPAYDSQEQVYNQLIATINDALSSIDAGAAGPQGDAIFGGDMAMWTKFGNTLKLRVGIRMADVNPSAAQAAVESAIANGADGIIATNEDNAIFAYLSGAPNNNPINEDYKTRNDFAASNTMVDYLAGLNDPRLGVYFSPREEDGTFVGEVYGLSEENAALTPNTAVSQRGAAILAADMPGIFLDAASTHFILAEAAERGWGSLLTAAEHYSAGVALSMQFWGISDEAAILDYLAQADVAYDTAPGDWKAKIGAQKWIALYMQGYEAWAEYRRLDFGILQACADGALQGDGGVPSRFQYPLDEQTLNNASWTAGVAANGGDDEMSTKLWWDVN
jgi:hypothetical protein